MALETPILFCIYNRPEVTRRVFDAIARTKPRRLLVVGDGPKPGDETDRQRVALSQAIVEQVDWKCDLTTHFSSDNMGCKFRMASGITWAFEQEERLIILEDDCLPGPAFFTFSEALLERYADDQRVMMISGDNFQPCTYGSSSYYFSKWAHIWGWASWRRAWDRFDVEIPSWPQVRDRGLLRSMCENEREYQHWLETFDRQHRGEIDTWDFPWMYSCWMNHGLTILPQSNLVSNIGFGPDATHTKSASSLQNLPVSEIDRLQHPELVVRNQPADLHTLQNHFLKSEVSTKPKLWDRILNRRNRAA